MRDWSTHRCWQPWVSWNKSLMDVEGWLDMFCCRYYRTSKMYTRILIITLVLSRERSDIISRKSWGKDTFIVPVYSGV